MTSNLKWMYGRRKGYGMRKRVQNASIDSTDVCEDIWRKWLRKSKREVLLKWNL